MREPTAARTRAPQARSARRAVPRRERGTTVRGEGSNTMRAGRYLVTPRDLPNTEIDHGASVGPNFRRQRPAGAARSP